jgi:threonine/homoserine/homoserine lactone efflux protein
MMPGPFLTVTISESAKQGIKAGPLLITGHGILELVLIIALSLGLAPLFSNPIFFTAMALIGGMIMLWMAWGMFRSLPTLSIGTSAETKSRRNNLLLTGALMSLVNPYWIIWWATIGTTYIVHSQKAGFWGVACFFAGHILGDAAWYVSVSAAISKGRKLFTARTYRILIAICGTFLVLFAGWLVWNGFKNIL